MRILLISILALLFSSVAYAQDKKTEYVEKKNSDGVVIESYTLVDGKIEGAYIRRHSNGKTEKEGDYKGGKQTGAWSWYTANGNKSFEATYVDGNLAGVATSYHEGNGAKYREGVFVEGRLKGAWTQYHENGLVHATGQAYSSGWNDISNPLKTGPWIWNHANGNRYLEVSLTEDKFTGLATQYYESGAKLREGTFVEARLNGPWTQYHENGLVHATGQAYSSGWNDITNPLKTGPWTWNHANGNRYLEVSLTEDKFAGLATQYYESGAKLREGTFVEARLNGPWTHYYESGQVYVTGQAYSSGWNDISNPLKTGPWIWNHANGNRYLTATLTEDKFAGLATQYYESGAKLREGTFVEARLNGPWTHYYESGQVYVTGQAYSSGWNDISNPLKTGPWIWNHESGNRYLEISYTEDTPDGPALEFYAGGGKRIECMYDMGTLTDTWSSWYDNAQLAALGEAMGRDMHSPTRTGLWVEYHTNGNRSHDGNYVNGALDGGASWYYEDGSKRFLTEWVEGTMRGVWHSWHDNEKTAGHGHCYGVHYGYATPLKQGPWVWYHGNGNKESEGRYVQNEKVGAWIYYDANEKLKKVENYINGESKALSDAELPDGSHVYRVSNPDGSSDTLTFDKDGKLVSNKHELPLDKQKPYVQYTDPDTGETVTITHDSDGHPTRTHGTTTKDDKGNTHTVETDDDGKIRVIDENADGSKTIIETWPDGTLRETNRDKTGNVTRTRTNPDGSITQYENHPDGSRSRKRTDADGKLVDETFRDPSGVETTNRADGTSTRRHKDEDGNTVETTTRPDGGKSRVVRDPEGNIISRDDKWGEREPGQTVYEDKEGGHDWDKLTDEDKKNFADKEEALKENGGLDEARIRADEAAMRERDEAREEADAAAAEAEKDLARKPAADGAEKEKKEVNWEEMSLALKAVELALMMPDVLIEHIKSELTQGMSDEAAEEAKVADMLKQDARGLPGWLARNPKVLKNWEERVKPTLKSGLSAIAAAFSVLKGIQHAEKAEYFDALACFADASVSVFGILPPSVTEKLEKELNRNPAKYAAAVKNAITFAKEAGRPLKAGESRNYFLLTRETIGFLTNIYQAVPKAEREAFMKRYMPTFKKWLEAGNKNIRAGGRTYNAKPVQILMGVLECAEEIYKLFSEWGGENDAANITSLAKKVGPKAIGMLVTASTGSETAGSVAEYIAQLGADYMAKLGDEAREAAKAALRAAMDDANAYTRMRNELNKLALAAGMSEADAATYEFLSTAVCGHSSRMVLSDMRVKKDASGVREAIEAWRRINTDMGSRCGSVQAFYDRLVPDKERDPDNEAAYQAWFRTWVDNARRTATHVNTILADYARGGAAHRFLSTWKADLDDLVRVYG